MVRCPAWDHPILPASSTKRPVATHVIEWHDPQALTGESLRAACITDVLQDGLSMVYSYFDVADPSNSYGTFMILSLMDVCRRSELPYLYLGYWVEGSASMDYKAAFHPRKFTGQTAGSL